MRLWRVTYLDGAGTGALQDATFFLPEPGDVRRAILRKGGHPVAITEERVRKLAWWHPEARRWRKDLLSALRFLSRTTSPAAALLTICERETNPRRRGYLLAAETVLRAGGGFADALSRLGVFDHALIAILVAGERTGDMKAAIREADDYLLAKARTARNMRGALVWLAVEIGSTVFSLISLKGAMLPLLRGSASQSSAFQAKLDIAMIATDFTLAAWAVAGAVGGWLTISFLANRGNNDHAAARLAVRLPIVGAFLSAQAIADTMTLVSRSVAAGVPFLRAAEIARDHSATPDIRRYWQGVLTSAGVRGPGNALAQPPLSLAEQDKFRSTQELEDVVEVLDAVTEERGVQAAVARGRLVRWGFVLSIAMIGGVLALYLWVVLSQQAGLLEMFKMVRGGL